MPRMTRSASIGPVGGEHGPGLEAVDVDAAADVDAVRAHRLGDPLAEVGVEDAHRLGRPLDDGRRAPRSMYASAISRPM